MPIRITNQQSKIAGEILDFEALTTGSKTVSTIFSTISSQSITFDADRNGQILLFWNGYITNSSSSNTKVDVSLRLVNQNNIYVSGTEIIAHTFMKPGSTVSNFSGQFVTATWLLNITDGSTYTYKPQIKKTSTTNTITLEHGTGYNPSTFYAVGL